MSFLKSPIPKISISPAPREEPPIEPYSPFSSASLKSVSGDGTFRSQHLTPPPTLTTFGRSLSPLRPVQDSLPARGLERERFEALLQASRERNTSVGAKKAQDLRKEIALKAHKNKQFERRALFLSKVLAPPSPTAIDTPKTPPDSPAIFHYTLPSPGMVSPLSLFESLGSGDSDCGAFIHAGEPWVEQVDFRLPEDQWNLKEKAKKPPVSRPAKLVLPSLDEIAARLDRYRPPSPPALVVNEDRRSTTRLPAFLRTSQQSTPVAAKSRPKLSIGIGRLQMPLPRDVAPQHVESAPSYFPPPKSPRSPVMPNIQITTLVVPRSATMSPTYINESNLLALNSCRERTSNDMLSALKRRTITCDGAFSEREEEAEDRKSRRLSSPPDLPRLKRTGFEHPVLSMPGGF